MTPAKTQLLIAPDVHSATAPSAAANTIIPIASLILERAFCISLMNMIIGPAPVHPYPNGVARNAYWADAAQRLGAKLSSSTEVGTAAKAAVWLFQALAKFRWRVVMGATEGNMPRLGWTSPGGFCNVGLLCFEKFLRP